MRRRRMCSRYSSARRSRSMMSTRCTTPRVAAAAAAAAARRPSRPRARPAARAITCAPAPHLLTQPACSRAAQAQLEFFQSRLIDSLEQKQRAMARQVGFKHGRRPADPAKGDAKGGEGDAKRAKVVCTPRRRPPGRCFPLPLSSLHPLPRRRSLPCVRRRCPRLLLRSRCRSPPPCCRAPSPPSPAVSLTLAALAR